LKPSYTVSEALFTLIQENFDPQTTHNWNFRMASPAMPRMSLRCY